MPRRRIPENVLEQGLELVLKGAGNVEEAAESIGVGRKALYSYLHDKGYRGKRGPGGPSGEWTWVKVEAYNGQVQTPKDFKEAERVNPLPLLPAPRADVQAFLDNPQLVVERFRAYAQSLKDMAQELNVRASRIEELEEQVEELLTRCAKLEEDVKVLRRIEADWRDEQVRKARQDLGVVAQLADEGDALAQAALGWRHDVRNRGRK